MSPGAAATLASLPPTASCAPDFRHPAQRQCKVQSVAYVSLRNCLIIYVRFLFFFSPSSPFTQTFLCPYIHLKNHVIHKSILTLCYIYRSHINGKFKPFEVIVITDLLPIFRELHVGTFITYRHTQNSMFQDSSETY
jgi:hypothetical protein